MLPLRSRGNNAKDGCARDGTPSADRDQEVVFPMALIAARKFYFAGPCATALAMIFKLAEAAKKAGDVSMVTASSPRSSLG
jgi:hypothetical protein